ncbi:carbohydrate ABC transporter permease [Agromyces silvae]|uniref:carbohydrate ABC transporter permease n=1 Tax=Agromyces silvae TaxID=3388266 RepID=UPI00280AA7B8|nr:carbohydrate ABC transporter permease [Agromyces protaetiae]
MSRRSLTPPRSAAVRSGVVRWIVTGVLVMIAVVTLYPLLYTVINSLKENSDFAGNPMGLPATITWDNYLETFQRMNVPRLLVNSLLASAGGVVLSTLAALLVAYVTTKMRFPGRSIVFLFMIAMLVIPSQAIIYPLYETVIGVGLGGNLAGVVLVYAAFGLPLSVYLLATYFRAVPDEMLEAARMDGAGHVRTLFSVMLPVATPAIASLAIFNFVWMWNDLILPLVILGGSENATLMVGVSLLSGQYDISIPLISAALVVALLPVMIIYLVFQRQILAGAMAGAVK